MKPTNIFDFYKSIINFTTNLKSNYWFVPAVMTLSSIIASIIMVWLDKYLGADWLSREFNYTNLNQPDGARALLSTIAGSMITVAGVTFSMTLLSVSHASSQIGPRILSGFMSDKGNQVTLGTFISTFVYCILVLRTINSKLEQSEQLAKTDIFVPHLSIFLALVFALLSVTVLIYFINHVPETINMTSVINRVGNQLMNKIEDMSPKEEAETNIKQNFKELPNNFEKSKINIHIKGRGFFKFIDVESLKKLAIKENILIELRSRPGDYLLPKSLIASYYHYGNSDIKDISDDIKKYFFWGAERSNAQDFFSPVDLLVEVAARALSPGTNDPNTANECVNQFSSALIKMSFMEETSSYRSDNNGHLRLIIPTVNQVELLDHFCNKYRGYCKTDLVTSMYFIKSLNLVYKTVKQSDLKLAIKSQIDYLYNDTKHILKSSQDTYLLDDLYYNVN